MTKFQAQMAGSAGDFRSRVVRPGVMRRASGVMRFLLCSLVRAYQILLSPLLPRTCRFTPSCSEYMIQAITVYGVRRGVGKGLWRLLRCQPFAKGGYDPVTRSVEFRMQNAECKVQNEAECASALSAVRK
jgi:hypothetical protein